MRVWVVAIIVLINAVSLWFGFATNAEEQPCQYTMRDVHEARVTSVRLMQWMADLEDDRRVPMRMERAFHRAIAWEEKYGYQL